MDNRGDEATEHGGKPMPLQQATPTRSGLERWQRSTPILIGITIIVVGFFVWESVNFHSMSDALCYLKGSRMVVDPSTISVGEGVDGEEKETSFQIRNLTGNPIQLIGLTTNCTCISSDELPLTIAPHGSGVVRVKIRFDGRTSDRISQRIVYYTDSPNAGAFDINILGRVKK